MAETGTTLTLKQDLMTSLEKAKDSLPKGFKTERFVDNAIGTLTKNSVVSDFVKKNGALGMAQLKSALMRAAYTGMDYTSGEYYLYPFGSTLNFSLSPKGTRKMLKKYSTEPIVKGPHSFLVYEGETFKHVFKDDIPWFEYIPSEESERIGKNVIGACAYVVFANGDKRYEYMNVNQINACKKKSKTSNQGPWVEFWDRMALKTVLHRLANSIDTDFDSIEQGEVFAEDMAITNDPQEIRDNEVMSGANSVDFEEVEDAEVKPVPAEEIDKMVTPFQ